MLWHIITRLLAHIKGAYDNKFFGLSLLNYNALFALHSFSEISHLPSLLKPTTFVESSTEINVLS